MIDEFAYQSDKLNTVAVTPVLSEGGVIVKKGVFYDL